VRPFDLATWASIAILVVGSLAVFVWFLKDAGTVLKGEEDDSKGGGQAPNSGSPLPDPDLPLPDPRSATPDPTPPPPPEPPSPALPPSCSP
jgi:hypothetical protein